MSGGNAIRNADYGKAKKEEENVCNEETCLYVVETSLEEVYQG